MTFRDGVYSQYDLEAAKILDDFLPDQIFDAHAHLYDASFISGMANSDAFAICNSIDVQVTDCFARTGDDMFEVKTLGGVDTAVSRDITFRRCQAWGSKARCFGIIGEIEKIPYYKLARAARKAEQEISVAPSIWRAKS